MEILIWFLAAWVACGVLSFGLTLGYFLRKYPQLVYRKAHEAAYPGLLAFRNGRMPGAPRDDAVFSLVFSILGPVALFIAFIGGGFGRYGLKYRWWVEEPYRP